jgi:hypothetical protein
MFLRVRQKLPPSRVALHDPFNGITEFLQEWRDPNLEEMSAADSSKSAVQASAVHESLSIK